MRPRASWRCRSRKGPRSRLATSNATSTTPNACRWKPVSTPRPFIIHVPARPPTTRKRPRPLSKNASRRSEISEGDGGRCPNAHCGGRGRASPSLKIGGPPLFGRLDAFLEIFRRAQPRLLGEFVVGRGQNAIGEALTHRGAGRE